MASKIVGQAKSVVEQIADDVIEQHRLTLATMLEVQVAGIVNRQPFVANHTDVVERIVMQSVVELLYRRHCTLLGE